MIDINNIMIDDIFYHKELEKPIRIDYVDSHMNEIGFSYEMVTEPDDNIVPIEITEGLLEMNGFDATIPYAIFGLGEGKFIEYYYHENRLTIYWEGIDEWENHSKAREVIFRCTCKYLHELQHAFKFAGIEHKWEI